MRLHDLQKARPNMLGTGGMDGEGRMPVPSGCGADQFPGLRPTRLAKFPADIVLESLTDPRLLAWASSL